MVTKHSDRTGKSNVKVKSNVIFVRRCFYCPRTFSGNKDRIAHWLADHRDFTKFVDGYMFHICPICKKEYNSSKFSRHFKEVHNGVCLLE